MFNCPKSARLSQAIIWSQLQRVKRPSPGQNPKQSGVLKNPDDTVRNTKQSTGLLSRVSGEQECLVEMVAEPGVAGTKFP